MSRMLVWVDMVSTPRKEIDLRIRLGTATWTTVAPRKLIECSRMCLGFGIFALCSTLLEKGLMRLG